MIRCGFPAASGMYAEIESRRSKTDYESDGSFQEPVRASNPNTKQTKLIPRLLDVGQPDSPMETS